MSRFISRVGFGPKAKAKLLKGMNIVAEAVSSTLGPKGRNVAISDNAGLPPRIIHDGIGVAKKIDLEDYFENMGAQLLKEAALQTSKKAGDGTTTSTILAQTLITKGFENITAGANPMILKSQIEEATKLVTEQIKKLSTKISTLEEKVQVAMISSVSQEIGKMVGEAVHKVGRDGLINVDESKSFETYIEYKQGLEYDRGIYSNHFVTNGETNEAIISDPYILITDIKINRDYQILPFLENMARRNIKNIVIIGETLEQALAVLVINKLKGSFNIASTQAPAYGDRRLQELEDIAIATGGMVIAEDSGRELKSVVPEELGRADKFISDFDKSKIIGGRGDKTKIKGRIKELKKAIKNAKTQYDEDIKKQRLAKLAGTAAVIYIGAQSDPELADKRERFDDAINAVKCAAEEGVVAGGEITLLYISQMDFWPDTLGAKILKEAIKSPFKKLMENAGLEYAEVWGKISPLKYPYGIDVMNGQKKNLIEEGIIDPTKVVRLALENAVSVAVMGITTDTLISQFLKEVDK